MRIDLNCKRLNIFPVLEFESNGGEGKHVSITTVNDIEVHDAARRLQVAEKFDMIINAVGELCKTL